jgi:HAD superfamily hydrolase (TIGR01509 family)
MPREFLLWDHDGVLVDTERWYFHATREVLSRIGINLSQEQYLEFMAVGRSCWDFVRASGQPEARISEHRKHRDELYQQLLRSRDIEIEGVMDVLDQLKSRYRMAIVTTARRADFDLIHQNRSLLRYFEFVLTIEDYPHPKPAPDPYLFALNRFRARPEQTLVLEDSSRGLSSAVAAGLSCIVIKNEFTAAQDFSSAVCVLDSVRQLPQVLERNERWAVPTIAII